MNLKINNILSYGAIKSLYEDNKQYSLPVVSIIVSFLLFFIFIVPQVLSFPSRKQEVDIETEKLDKIKETEKILQNADIGLIDPQLKTASKALPPGKSFEEILNGISTAAALSAVQIESYKFDKQITETTSEKNKFSSLLFEVSIIGTTKDAISFIKDLYKTYPASDVTSIISSQGTTSIKILFYYKSFSSISPTDRTELKSMSAMEKAALDEISKWNDTSIEGTTTPFVTATESAEADSSPF